MRLHDRAPQADIIVRAGRLACQVALRTLAGLVHAPAPPVTAVDTTGAGDAHSGVFLAALADSRSPLDAAARANAAAAYAVDPPGAGHCADPGSSWTPGWLARPDPPPGRARSPR